ncbi:hypothetical protein NLX83_28765 [Allokutzneria sp. A3M-2-11 16]|uniref:hypothetical protein n=1 Tax=Allokutzneria sp. A3M-2-11 16 TaxID=2962043 RepID=UPI0020B6848E|nr:hypothetical protein [Allokutzneria sp. A3M-2-11 16]MCP3803277.1 hypothetical protein [Allokutzneria sp. A3M-2-11 16]
MNRAVVLRVHLTASSLALLLVLTFQIVTVTVELGGDAAAIAAAKRGIALGLFVLVPALAAAGGTGRKLAGRSRAPFVVRKTRRMIAIASVGVLVLVPCAVALDQLAAVGDLGGWFQVIQYVELAAGLLNLTLLGLNFRDGRAVTRQGSKWS